MTQLCSAEECAAPCRAKGFCGAHYYRWRRYGDPGKGRTPYLRTLTQRFWSKVSKSEACWLWVGTVGSNGYGYLRHQGKDRLGHRLAYELLVGPIPEGLELDHLCRNRRCVRPDHLEAVTHQVNVRRGRGGEHNATKTHCPWGHPYDEANTVTRDGRRFCLACRRERDRGRRGRFLQEQGILRGSGPTYP